MPYSTQSKWHSIEKYDLETLLLKAAKKTTMNASSTIDEEERSKFNHLAQTWWNPEGPMWPLHGLNNFRVEHVIPLLQQHFDLPNTDNPLKDLNILDIGCGGGLMSEALSRLGANVHGIDIAEKNILIARQHAETQGLKIDYDNLEVKDLVASERLYDVVLNLEVMEHVSDLKLFLPQCNELLSKNGITIMSTINRTFKSWLFAIMGAEYILNILPRGTHEWKKFVQPEEVKALCALDNFRVVWEAGVNFNPFTKQFKLTSDMAVNYMLAARRH
ncbi:MAG: bifunctional 2-polyprenyl-6-hydroxyphenol methylase/3-demethylubiquinol 3-O-methyltransferase UbiG [Pseudomonadales bacterium]|nr:bifunctional 2-polyprenyl-6-hydroxyphenol methylase/3-demethylubiquinol 3-O-methyltransferase UbiG [Pseudomonadales bacterium]